MDISFNSAFGTDMAFSAQAEARARGVAQELRGAERHAELREACQGFEAQFIYKLMQQMRKAIPKGGLFPESHQKEIYQSMFDMEVAEQMAKAGGIGLADRLYEELSVKIEEDAD